MDVAATEPGEPFTDLTSRTVDSMVLPFADEPTTVRLVAGPGRSEPTSLDLHVRTISILDRSLVDYTVNGSDGQSTEPLDGTPLPFCGNDEFNTFGGECRQPLPGFSCVDCVSPAFLLAPLALLGKRRRQLKDIKRAAR